MINRSLLAGASAVVAAACAGGGSEAAREARTVGPAPDLAAVEVGVREPPWPRVTSTFPPLDITRVVSLSPGSSETVFRTDILLVFEEGVTDNEIVAFLRSFDAKVTAVADAGPTSHFFLRIPDPGPDLDALRAGIDRMEDDPRVLLATVLLASTPTVVVY